MKTTPAVITEVVNNDLCIGCGACVQACPSKALDVQWNEFGFLVATITENPCNNSGACIEVCPFNPIPGADYKNEDDLAKIFITSAPQRHEKVGRYQRIYVGYSKKFRRSSSSGGIATFVYEKLFEKGLIDHVVAIGDSGSDGAHYQYNIISNKDDLLTLSKTRYHPVTLATALDEIKQLQGRVAISGVGCFIKAIRLAQTKDPVLKEKIVFLVGIICGGVKSKFFTDYLASKAGSEIDGFSNPQYRVKDLSSTAMDYGFSCVDQQTMSTNLLKMREVGDMWGTGMFKANACDFCDDVTTELADISVGDAWMPPYNQDGAGHNVVVSRTITADAVLREGRASGELEVESIPLEQFLASQQGSFNHRHNGLGTRIALVEKRGFKVPPKRPVGVQLPVHLGLIQRARRRTRVQSLQVWARTKNATEFDESMKYTLILLKILTRVSHAVRRLKRLKRH